VQVYGEKKDDQKALPGSSKSGSGTTPANGAKQP
jgi:hypothetical protein